jgi:hypothetical protein
MATRKTRSDPDTYEQTPGASESTGAVPGPPAATEHTAPWHHADADVRVATPTGPTTMTVSWLSAAETKRITAEHQGPPAPASSTASTKSKGSSDSTGDAGRAGDS